jgi:BirA family biotin operon repressor/biotin-[acetyl-CoA-carboxylase] ligase
MHYASKKENQLFNFENFDIKLDTEFIGRNFYYYDELISTNAQLLDKTNKFNINGTVLLAEKQFKGKGRREKVWYSAKEQNLTFSILLTDKNLWRNNFNLLNFVSSLAVALSIENLYQLKTELKWPNDILLNRKKAAGILVESASKGENIERVIIGIGLNVNQTSFQGSFNIEPTSIKLEMNQPIERERLLAEVLNNFEEVLGKLTIDPGWILKDWKARCRMIGEKIQVVANNVSKSGVFSDIDENGFLILRRGNNTEKIYSADVSLIQ